MNDQGAMPAYPCQPRGQQGNFVDDLYPGLTKRERFAMAAMQGLCANYRFMDGAASALESMGIPRDGNDNARGVRKLIAKAAIGTADELLAALSDQPTRQEDA